MSFNSELTCPSALSAVAILQFQGAWNSFFWPLILLRDKDYFTVPISLNFFRTAGGILDSRGDFLKRRRRFFDGGCLLFGASRQIVG